MTANSPTSATKTVSKGPPLRSVLEIELEGTSECAVMRSEADVDALSQNVQNLVCNTPQGDYQGECHNEITLTEGTENVRKYVTGSVNSGCICPIFSSFDCVPEFRGVKDGAFIVTVTVPDRSVLQELIGELRQAGATVRLRRIHEIRQTSNETLQLDASKITKKQREAINVAVEMGYYDTPRRADLDDLAQALDISKSAVSQRLNAVESHLITSLATEQ